MGKEQLQEICNLIQDGFKSETQYPITNRQDNHGKWYWSMISIDGMVYFVDMNREIVIDNVEL